MELIINYIYDCVYGYPDDIEGSDTVTSIFKCNSSNGIKSLHLLKMA